MVLFQNGVRQLRSPAKMAFFNVFLTQNNELQFSFNVIITRNKIHY
jgi:hypothetical protein